MPRRNTSQVHTMSSDALQQAKELFDQELDQATEEVVKRWENMYKRSGKKYNLADLLKKLGKHARAS